MVEMDLATLLGLIIGFSMLIGGFILEGGHVGSLFLLPPALIVFGGTLGAVMISFDMKDIKKLPKLFLETFKARTNSEDEIIEYFGKIAETARKEGLLSLEVFIDEDKNNTFDPMLKEGVKMVIDGTDGELIKNMFENEMYVKEQIRKVDASMFEAAGGYSPTMGIIGTVMGLIHVLGNLSSPEELSKSIAGAFIATLYGVAFANVVYLPMASKIKQKAKQEALEKQLIMEGILSVQTGENPSILRRKLNTFKTETNKIISEEKIVKEE
jgi:chemotaxis protein MotA